MKKKGETEKAEHKAGPKPLPETRNPKKMKIEKGKLRVSAIKKRFPEILYAFSFPNYDHSVP